MPMVEYLELSISYNSAVLDCGFQQWHSGKSTPADSSVLAPATIAGVTRNPKSPLLERMLQYYNLPS